MIKKKKKRKSISFRNITSEGGHDSNEMIFFYRNNNIFLFRFTLVYELAKDLFFTHFLIFRLMLALANVNRCCTGIGEENLVMNWKNRDRRGKHGDELKKWVREKMKNLAFFYLLLSFYVVLFFLRNICCCCCSEGVKI